MRWFVGPFFVCFDFPYRCLVEVPAGSLYTIVANKLINGNGTTFAHLTARSEKRFAVVKEAIELNNIFIPVNYTRIPLL